MVSKRRPLFSNLGNTNAPTHYLESLEDVLPDRGHNAVLEGAEHTAPTLVQPNRLFAHVQTFARWGQVSDDQRDTSHYNEDPFVYQTRKQVDALLNDIRFGVCRRRAA